MKYKLFIWLSVALILSSMAYGEELLVKTDFESATKESWQGTTQLNDTTVYEGTYSLYSTNGYYDWTSNGTSNYTKISIMSNCVNGVAGDDCQFGIKNNSGSFQSYLNNYPVVGRWGFYCPSNMTAFVECDKNTLEYHAGSWYNLTWVVWWNGTIENYVNSTLCGVCSNANKGNPTRIDTNAKTRYIDLFVVNNFNEIDEYPTITSRYPDNNSLQSSSTFSLNCSVYDARKISNVSLWHNLSTTWALNQTVDLNASEVTTADIQFNLSGVADINGSVWNCVVYDNNTQYTWGNNYTINVTNINYCSLNVGYTSCYIEDFEGVGIPINWSDTGSPDYDNPTEWEGSEGLSMSNGDSSYPHYLEICNLSDQMQTEVYMLRNTTSGLTGRFYFGSSNDFISQAGDGDFYCLVGGGEVGCDSGGIHIANDTWYKIVKIDYIQNNTADLYIYNASSNAIVFSALNNPITEYCSLTGFEGNTYISYYDNLSMRYRAGTKTILNIEFYCEDNNILLDNTTVTASFISSAYSTNLSTTNGTMSVNLTTGSSLYTEYDIKYSANGYDIRDYYILVYNSTYVNLDLFLLNDTRSTTFEFLVQDSSGIELEGEIVSALAYFVDCNCWKTIEMSKSDFLGVSVMNLVQYSRPYFFKIYHNWNLVKTTNQTKLSSTTPYFVVTVLDSWIEGIVGMNSTVVNLDYDNTTNKFTLDYTDTTSTYIVEGCLKVTRKTTNYEAVICNNCSISPSSSLSCGVDPSLQGEYIAEGIFKTSSTYSVETYIQKIVNFYDSFKSIGTFGLFLTFLIVMATAFLFIVPEISIGLAIFGFFMASIWGLTYSNTIINISLVAVAIIIIIKNGKK